MISQFLHHTLARICFLIRTTYAALFIIVGVDKFFNIMTQWDIYVSPHVLQILPIPAATFLAIFGVIQIITGVLFLTRWYLWGAYTGLIILISIFINLITMDGITVVLIHDLVMMLLLVLLLVLTNTLKTES